MLRWLIVFLLALVIFQGASRWLRHIGLGRLPGDIVVRWRDREFSIPVASSIVLSFIAAGISLLF
jgi:hypothetical protein